MRRGDRRSASSADVDEQESAEDRFLDRQNPVERPRPRAGERRASLQLVARRSLFVQAGASSGFTRDDRIQAEAGGERASVDLDANRVRPGLRNFDIDHRELPLCLGADHLHRHPGNDPTALPAWNVVKAGEARRAGTPQLIDRLKVSPERLGRSS